ncbi:hypothetical protein D3C73_714570 [compost metagenome]
MFQEILDIIEFRKIQKGFKMFVVEKNMDGMNAIPYIFPRFEHMRFIRINDIDFVLFKTMCKVANHKGSPPFQDVGQLNFLVSVIVAIE